MTPTERARLGGLSRAVTLSASRRQAIARQGGVSLYEKYGSAGMKLVRKGRKIKA